MAKTLGRFASLRTRSCTGTNESEKESRSLTAKDAVTAAGVMRGRLETIAEAEAEAEAETETETGTEEEEKELENMASGTPGRSLSSSSSASLKLERCQILCRCRGRVLFRVRLHKLVTARLARARNSYVRFMNRFATKAHISSSSSEFRSHY